MAHEFNEENHAHVVDGEDYRSCTEVLNIIAKPFLIQWAADLAAMKALNDPGLTERYSQFEQIEDKDERKKFKAQMDKDFPKFKEARTFHIKKKNDAASWGKAVHKAIEIWVKTKSVPTTLQIGKKNVILIPEQLDAVNKFVQWCEENKVEILLSEQNIHSKEWKVGGITDLVLMKDGLRYIVDIKTSSDIYESFFLQMSAYAKMMIEMGMYDYFDRIMAFNIRKNGTLKIEERKDIEGNIKCYEAAIILCNRFN